MIISYNFGRLAMNTDNEKKILIKLQQGDYHSFEQIYHVYKARIYYNLLKIIRSDSIAEELLQDVFMKVWDYRQLIDVDKKFSSFLFSISRNIAIDFYRKTAKQKLVEALAVLSDEEAYNHIENHINFKEASILLEQAINKLPPQRQRIFKLCKLEGKSYEQVAEELGISRGTVQDHIVKAHRFLKEELSTEYNIHFFLLAIAFSNL